MHKIVGDKATGIVLVPLWKLQPWYPLFLKLTVGKTLFLGADNNNILVAANLSGRHTDKKCTGGSYTNTMMKSLSDSTLRQYNTTFKLWWNFYGKINFFSFGGMFLIFYYVFSLYFQKNCVYCSFNSHRAAVSRLVSAKISQDPHLRKLLKGIFRMNLPKPRYNSIWDYHHVLTTCYARLGTKDCIYEISDSFSACYRTQNLYIILN